MIREVMAGRNLPTDVPPYFCTIQGVDDEEEEEEEEEVVAEVAGTS